MNALFVLQYECVFVKMIILFPARVKIPVCRVQLCEGNQLILSITIAGKIHFQVSIYGSWLDWFPSSFIFPKKSFKKKSAKMFTRFVSIPIQNFKKTQQNTYKFNRLHIIVKIRNNYNTNKYILYTDGITFGRLVIQSFSKTKPSSLQVYSKICGYPDFYLFYCFSHYIPSSVGVLRN